ncbi:hypothetical protein Vadar_026025 [Vaccinium darrowii]|uniref:Uncharacterized protein n=1 Tax=Vaccinium darrowii TaxID=229202 RepID=A0ACB7Y1S7_9ERIC|nr:hypothetical protein Vadar_026025 [Vaccinium darrowii]
MMVDGSCRSLSGFAGGLWMLASVLWWLARTIRWYPVEFETTRSRLDAITSLVREITITYVMEIPTMMVTMKEEMNSSLTDSRLNNNSLTGPIPLSLTDISSLQVLDLSNNHLSGAVPVDGSFSLFTSASFSDNPEGIFGGFGAGAALLLAVLALAFAWWHRRKPKEYFIDVPAKQDLEVHLGQLKRFSLRELQVATDGFSKENILGRGGFGKVYKGQLADGTVVAVKRLKEEGTPRGEMQFQTEVEMISMAVHRNLLKLRGFCMAPTERLLVYPYMANGSVASCLSGCPPNKPPLDWPTRRRIALGSARGLSYLHDHCDLKIIHGQKSFDLARLAKDGDVMLLDWVKGILKEKKLEMLVDPDLQNNFAEQQVEQLIQVALLCTQDSPRDRPKMSEVVRMLEGDGLAEQWNEWQKGEVLRQEVELAPHLNCDRIVDSTGNLHAVELSGPR